MKRVFVDTGAFFAVLVTEDLHHERARVIFTQAGEERWQLVTTNMVVVETYALLLNRAHGGRPSALAFLDAIERDEYQIERVKESDEAAAIDLVRPFVGVAHRPRATDATILEEPALPALDRCAPGQGPRRVGR